MRAIKIDPITKNITEITNTGLRSLQESVGGRIETAYDYPDGSTCFVNEEGLFENPQTFFVSKYGHQPFAGAGVIVGPANKNGETTSCTLDIKDIINTTKFLTLEEVRNLYDL